MAAQPDHAGLQVIEDDHHAYAPEVATNEAPESLKRSPSTAGPEVWRSTPQQQYYDNPAKNDHQGENIWSSKEQDDVRAYYDPKPPAYTEPPEKRILGMRRKVFYIVLGVVVLCIVILAAVLGGVLGSRSSSSSSSKSSSSNNSPSSTLQKPVRTQKNSGLALVLPPGTNGDDGVYSYHIASNGSIVENFADKASQLDTNSTSRVIVESGALAGSPIAAISRQFQNLVFRHIFFFDAAGNLLTTNSSDNADTVWQSPASILTRDTANVDSPALSACVDTNSNALNGIRIYYGSKSGYIQEVGTDFTTSQTIWNMWNAFRPSSDASTGVTCTINNDVNHLYFRNSTTKSIEQWTWDYNAKDGWKLGVVGANNLTAGGDIAAAFDGTSTDHIFYQTDGGQIQRTVFVNNGYSGYETLNASALDTKLSATYASGSVVGAVLAYQNASSDDAVVQTTTVNFNGQIVASGMLAGSV